MVPVLSWLLREAFRWPSKPPHDLLHFFALSYLSRYLPGRLFCFFFSFSNFAIAVVVVDSTS